MLTKEFINIIRTAWRRWHQAGPAQLAAAIAYNAVLSLAPLLLLLLAVAGRVLGSETTKTQLLASVQQIGGPTAEEIADSIIEMVTQARGGTAATVGSLIVLIYFSSSIFVRLKAALNTIWGVSPQQGLRRALYQRLRSFLMVPVAVTVIVMTLLINMLASIANPIFTDLVPKGAVVWNLVNAALSFGLVTLLLAFAFKYGPDVALDWSDVFGGAFLTAILLALGNYLLGLFIGRGLLASLYGVAGALILVLLWIYYSAQILLFGAAYTRAYSECLGSKRRTP